MSDREARVLGSGATIQIGDTTYQLSPITMKQLGQIQRAAVAWYKSEYLATYRDNVAILPKERQTEMLERKLEEVARWDIEDIPKKQAHNASNIPIEGAIVDWLNERFPDKKGDEWTELRGRRVLTAALDTGIITPDEIEKMTGTRPKSYMISYDMWWITGCFEGMVTMLWESVKIHHSRVKRSEVEMWPMAKQMEGARVVESLTSPDVGNM